MFLELFIGVISGFAIKEIVDNPTGILTGNDTKTYRKYSKKMAKNKTTNMIFNNLEIEAKKNTWYIK